MLLPKLTTKTIIVTDYTGDIPTQAQVWESVGLAIHQTKNEKWTVTHVVSGHGVLFDIPDKQQALIYLKKLKDIKSDWFFSIEYLRNNRELHMRLRNSVLNLREEIKRGKTRTAHRT